MNERRLQECGIPTQTLHIEGITHNTYPLPAATRNDVESRPLIIPPRKVDVYTVATPPRQYGREFTRRRTEHAVHVVPCDVRCCIWN